MSALRDTLARVVHALDRSSIPFMIAGSFASTFHGLPRTTQDIDVVIDPTAPALALLLGELPPDAWYVDADTARDALRRRSIFNAIDLASGWKIDFIVRKDRAFSRDEFARRRSVTLLGVAVFIASPEDTVVAKLEWSQQSGGSERQRRDVAGIVETIGNDLDHAYIERWVRVLGLDDEWRAVRGS